MKMRETSRGRDKKLGDKNIQNFGAIDGSSAAAPRYTEAKLDAVADWLALDGVDDGAVPHSPNYDGRLTEPELLPVKLPVHLLNGVPGGSIGVGFASLGSLQKLEVDRIKIDRSFISGMVKARSDQVLVQAVLSLARSLEIEVVAEGVENEETLQMLDRFGCPIVQGYHLSPPLPPAALLDRIRQWDAVLPRPATRALPWR